MRGMGQGSSAAMILIGALVSAPPNFSGAFVPACPAGHPLGFKIAAPCTMHWRARRGGGAAKVPSSSWHMKTRGDGYGTRMSPDAVGRGDDDTSECTGGIAEENSLSRRQAGYAQHTPGVSSGGSLLPVGGDGDEKAADDMAGRSHAKGRRSFLVLSAGLAGVSVGRAMEAHAVSRSFRSKDFDLQNPVDPEAMQSGRYLSELQNKEVCEGGWAPGWRSAGNNGKGVTCREPDGCVWRKLDERVKNPGGVKGYMQAENTYSMPFVAYLSRFILNYDERWATWWRIRQAALPHNMTPMEEEAALGKEFGLFAASVEYGLANYPGQDGVERLAEELGRVYGSREQEVRRQLVLLWATQWSKFQPSEAVASLAAGYKGGGIIQAPAQVAIARSWQQIFAESTIDRRLCRVGVPPLLPLETPVYRNEAGIYSLPVSVAYDDFGVRAYYPVRRERRLSPEIYAAFALSGLVGCAGTHAAVVPLDVVKTRMQSQPERYKSLGEGIKQIWREEGLAGLFAGGAPTLVGYAWYGLTVYPGYELFKRLLTSAVGEAYDAQYHVLLVLLSGACSTVFACLGVCPAEATRIRQVTEPDYAPTAVGVASRLVAEEGFLKGLYTGFSLLLVRQISFGMMKFLVFESVSSFVYYTVPFMDDNQALQLSVSLISGAVAGVVSTIVSQPADTVLTKMKASSTLSFSAATSQIYQKYGLGGFFLGLGSRCMWAGTIIAGQFLLYDLGKNLFQVTSDDLTLFLDVIGSITLTAK